MPRPEPAEGHGALRLRSTTRNFAQCSELAEEHLKNKLMPKAKKSKTRVKTKTNIAHSVVIGIAIICFSLVFSSFAVLIKVGIDNLRYF